MQLPDYTKSKKWVSLREKMGISSVKPFKTPKYKKNVIKQDPELTKGIKIKTMKDVEESINKKDQSLEDAKTGRKIVFHIQDINPNARSYAGYRARYKIRTGIEFNYSLPKYHISNCSTIQGFRKNKKFDTRYIKTDRADGKFEVIDPYTRKRQDKTLRVCKHCLSVMQRTHSHSIFKKRAEDFSIAEYFEKYNETKSTLLNQLSGTYNQNYTPKKRSKGWSNISSDYREKMHWTCEMCNVCYKNNRKRLHTHHKDGDPSNNKESNLIALCKGCHDTQPGHSKFEVNTTEYKPAKKSKTKLKPINIQSLKKKHQKKSFDTSQAIKMGEGQTVEFKETLLAHQKTKSIVAKSMMFNIFKTIVAFLNTDGGKIIIGVSDDGKIKGIQEIGEQFKTYDDLDLFFGGIFNKYLPDPLRDNCKWQKETIHNKDVFVIDVEKYEHKPVEILLTKKETHQIGSKSIKLTLPRIGADTEVLIRSGAQKIPLPSTTAEINYYRKRFPKYYQFMIAS